MQPKSVFAPRCVTLHLVTRPLLASLSCLAGVLLLTGAGCPGNGGPAAPPAQGAITFQQVSQNIAEGTGGDGTALTIPVQYMGEVRDEDLYLTVDWKIVGVTALPVNDVYGAGGGQPFQGSIDFVVPHGQATPVEDAIDLVVVPDDADESDETFRVEFMNLRVTPGHTADIAGIALGAPVVVTIQDDDGGTSGSAITLGTFATPALPEAMQFLPGGWGPVIDLDAKLLVIAHDGGVSVIDLTLDPPAIMATPGLFEAVTFPAVFGVAAISPAASRRGGAARAFSDYTEGILAASASNAAFQTYDIGTASFGLTALDMGARIDAVPVGGSPDGSAIIYTAPFGIGLKSFDTGTGTWSTSGFVASPVLAASAYEHVPGGPVVIASSMAPESLYVKASPTSGAALTPVGPLGDDPRRVRFLEPIGVVSNFGSDELTVFTWDGTSTTPVIVGNVPVGDGPVGVDLIETGGNIAVVSTGYNDNTYTLTILSPAGAVVSTTTTAVPPAIVNPGHAVFARDGVSTKIVISGNGSSNCAVVESGF